MEILTPSERRERRQSRIWWFTIVLSLLILLPLIGIVVNDFLSKDRLNQNTLCVEDAPVVAYSAVLIDITDSLNPIQAASLRNRFDDIKRDIPKGGMLAVFTVPEQPEDALEPLEALCNPGTGADLDRLTNNPELAQRRWEDDFERPLGRLLDTLLVREDSRYSPIMETIEAVKVASDSMLRDGLTEDQRSLIIFSDMLQHSSVFSHYRNPDASFRVVEQTAGSIVKTNLEDWKVSIQYIERHDNYARGIQGIDHIRFWEAFFEEMGGLLTEVERLDG